MIGTGLKKCIPITLWDLLGTTAAILVTDIELVFVAKIACSGACSPIPWKIFSLTLKSSDAASTTKSVSSNPLWSEKKLILYIISWCYPVVIRSFIVSLTHQLSINALLLYKEVSLSIKLMFKLAIWLPTMPIPVPIWPAPIMVIVFIWVEKLRFIFANIYIN